MRGKVREMYSLLMVVVMLATMINMGVQDVKAESKNVYFVKEIGFLKSIDGFTTPNGFVDKSETSTGNYILSDANNKASRGNYIYCIEPGKRLKGGETANSNNNAGSLFKNDKGVSTSEQKKYMISLLAGRTGFMKSWEGAEGWKSKTKYMVGQALIWEIVGGARDSNFNLIDSKYSLKNIYHFKNWNGDVPGTATEIKAYFNDRYDTWSNQIKNILKEEKKISYAKGGVYELPWNNGVFSRSFTDSNKVTSLFSYKYSSAKKVWSSKSSDGNTIKFTAYSGVEIPKSSPVTVTFTGKTVKVTGSIKGWIPKNGHQKVVSFGGNTSKNITCSMKLYTGEKPRGVIISKKDITGSKEVKGCSLKVVDSSGKTVASWVSNGTSHKISGLVKGKEYTLIETSPATGYTKASNIKFKIGDGFKTVVMKDDTVKVEIDKVDESGNFVKGAKLNIVDKSSGKVVKSIDTSGKAVRVDGLLAVGKEYIVKEVKVPDGYIKSSDVSFKVKNTGTVQKVKVVDNKTKVTINKVDEDGNRVSGAELEVVDKSTGKVIKKVVSSDDKDISLNGVLVVGKEYIVRETGVPDGYMKSDDVSFKVKNTSSVQKVEVVNVKTGIVISKVDDVGNRVAGAELEIIDKSTGEVVKKATSSSNKDIRLDGLLVVDKEYIVREVKVPDGYIKSKDVVFKVSGDEESLRVRVVDNRTKVVINKVDEDGNRVVGAELEIVDKSTGKVIKKVVSDGGSIELNGVLTAGGSYIIREVKAPVGYMKSSDVEFTVRDDGKSQSIDVIDKHTTSSIDKVDVNGVSISGAKLDIVDKDSGEVVKTIETGGLVDLRGELAEGRTYILREVLTPEGYVKAKDIEFTAGEEVKMIDKRVSVTKIDITDGEELPGAKIVVTDKSTGDKVDEWVSGEEPHYISGLEEGKEYILEEVVAPSGYYEAERIEFRVDGIDDNGIKINQHYVMEDAPVLTNLEVNKVDGEGNSIIGKEFSFGLYSDGECSKLVSEGILNQNVGKVVFEGLRFGTYYLKELKSPEGYKLSDEVVKVVINKDTEGVGFTHEVNVKNDKIVEKVDKADKGIMPTGVENNALFYIGCLMALVMLIICMFVNDSGRKR